MRKGQFTEIKKTVIIGMIIIVCAIIIIGIKNNWFSNVMKTNECRSKSINFEEAYCYNPENGTCATEDGFTDAGPNSYGCPLKGEVDPNAEPASGEDDDDKDSGKYTDEQTHCCYKHRYSLKS